MPAIIAHYELICDMTEGTIVVTTSITPINPDLIAPIKLYCPGPLCSTVWIIEIYCYGWRHYVFRIAVNQLFALRLGANEPPATIHRWPRTVHTLFHNFLGTRRSRAVYGGHSQILRNVSPRHRWLLGVAHLHWTFGFYWLGWLGFGYCNSIPWNDSNVIEQKIEFWKCNRNTPMSWYGPGTLN